jgi:hypothetical protein
MTIEEQLAKAMSTAMVADLQSSPALRKAIDDIVSHSGSLLEAKRAAENILRRDLERAVAGTGPALFPAVGRLVKSQLEVSARQQHARSVAGMGDFDWGALIGTAITAVGGVVAAKYQADTQEKLAELEAKQARQAAAAQEGAARAAEQSAARAEEAALIEMRQLQIPTGTAPGAAAEPSFLEKYGLYLGLGVAAVGVGVIALTRARR